MRGLDLTVVIPGCAPWRRPRIRTHDGGYGFRVRDCVAPRNDDRLSCPGLTRASITLREIAFISMDCRVKPGNDKTGTTTENRGMRRNSAQLLIALVLIAPLLAGCLERGKPTIVETSGDDDAICRANNVAAASSEYDACRKDRDTIRNNATAP